MDNPINAAKARGPRKSTLFMLRQFARCYSPAPCLGLAALPGVVLN